MEHDFEHKGELSVFKKDAAQNSPEHEQGGFALTSTPTEVHYRFMKEVIGRTIGKSRRKQPHQCVTVKLPYNDYARVTRVRERWELNQTDLIRFFFEIALPTLEAPPRICGPCSKRIVMKSARKGRQRPEDAVAALCERGELESALSGCLALRCNLPKT